MLKEEVQRLKSQVSNLEAKLAGDSDTISSQSIVGVRTLTLRYDADTKLILHVNSPFANYVRMKKEELIGHPTKMLASVLGGDIYKEISSPNRDVTIPPRISDAANTVYEVLTTEHDGVVDVVMRDMTEAQQFKSYVQRYFGLNFESLSDEDKRSLSFPERRFITISFTDLRGFTKFTESNNPEEVRNAINAYFDEVIEAAEENDVFPNQIVGDEVMVLYGAPKYHRDHPLRAVKTACEHIERVTRLRADYAKHGREIPHCGIGINSGDVIVGDMGSSVRDRKTYTALGTAVNLAARLCSAATSGQIILSEATLNAVLRVLPDGWEHLETTSSGSSDIFDASDGKPAGKIEDVIPLPHNLEGKEIHIGPGVASDKEEPEFSFRYLFQIKAKGISDALPVLTVERPKKTAMSKAALSDETEANEDGEMILGRYRLVAHIGRGGMGTVWRARDEFVNTVAIKMLNAGHGASESQVARFKREAKVMGKLAHRNICRIHEIGKAEGRIFIAMQFVDGVSLEQLISHQSIVTKNSVHSVGGHRSRTSIGTEGGDFSNIIDSVKSTEAEKSRSGGNSEDKNIPGEDPERFLTKANEIGLMVMTHQQSLAIIAKICDAVQFAHERGVLHRDLKPANIMIGRDGEPIVMDFGLAKLTRLRDDDDDIEKSLSISLEGQVVGTIEYMAPEQALSSKDVNEQADVYSIGAIFYHLLTGSKPFRSTGHILADAKALQDHEPVAPRKLDRLIDSDLETIILKALHPDRTQRYKSVIQVRQDIERYQNGDPISARKPTIGYRMVKKVRKNLVAFSASAIIASLLIFAAAFTYYDWRKNYGDWKEVFLEDFTDQQIDPSKFVALDEKGEKPEILWEVLEDGSGIRLPQHQWLWFDDKTIRGDAKVEVKMRFDGDPEQFQICLNGNRNAPPLPEWTHNPVGYSCRYGIWRGELAAISVNQVATPNDSNKYFSAKAPGNRDFLLTFQLKEGLLTLLIDNHIIHRESVIIPLRGDKLQDIGFRTWSENLVIKSIRIFRFTLPIEASPTVAGDVLVEIDHPRLAIEKYLTIAEDYPTEKPGALALTKAFQLWNQTYLRNESEPTPEEIKLRNRIEDALDEPGRESQKTFTEQTIAPLRALNQFARGYHQEALELIPEIMESNPHSRIAIECLSVDHESIPTNAAKQLLPLIAKTKNVAGADLHGLRLDDISPLKNIPNLTALDLRDNEISSLEPIQGKPLKVLYCMNNHITSLDPLSGMKLEELWCDNNHITDLKVMDGQMEDIHTFSCAGNQISDLSPLKGKNFTGDFYIYDNKIESLEPLRDVGFLKLFCSGNQISDLSPLIGKTDLSEIYCADNPISDLTPLTDIPIHTLDISRTNVTSIAPLIGHKTLKSLTCIGCEISDLDKLGPDVQIKTRAE